MTSRTFASLAARVGTNVPGCPHPLVVQYVREAARRFCERTLVWRFEQPAYTLTAGKHSYDFQKPTDTDVHSVLSATLDDAPLEVLTLDAALRLYPKWPVTTTVEAEIEANGSKPLSIAQVDSATYVVLPAPDAAAVYTVRMLYALKPSRTAVDMSESVLDACETAVYHGTLQQLLVIPDAAWSNKELATYHAKQFLYFVTEGRANANLGAFRGSLRVDIPRFA